MRFLKTITLALLLCPTLSFGQKIELINSGELIKQARTLSDSSKYKQADQLLGKISRNDTNYVWSLYLRGEVCEADSEYNRAIAYCREALALKEQREYEADIYNTYGNTLNEQGRHDEALGVFDTALAKYPSYSLLYFNKGVVMIALKKPKEAEELFEKALLINPYMYSAHYQLAVAEYMQGKLVPCFISLVGYLAVNPKGRYWSKAINALNGISHATDETVAQKNKSTWTPDENYRTMEEILLSKAALDPAYKPMITLDDPISRQIQATFEKLEYSENNPDFFIQYYLPFYKSVFNKEKFELFINWIFSNANVKSIQDYNKSNEKQINGLANFAADYFNIIRATRTLNYTQRDAVKKRYYYENGVLLGKGVTTPDGKKLTGHWDVYFSHGTLKATGEYNDFGQREGDWKFYFEGGQLKAIERYKDGKLNGIQNYYFGNGNPQSTENYVAGEADGLATTFFYAGNKRSLSTYKKGKNDGEETTFYSNGALASVKQYANGILNGSEKEYYKNTRLKAAEKYLNGKLDGPYKAYDETGYLSTEGQYTNDKAEGEWKFYYPNGKIKEKRNYVNDKEDGLHQEFYENGQVGETYNAKKSKIIGEADFYDKDGKLYSKMIYDNGILKLAKYFDKTGRELSSSQSQGKSLSIVAYTADGYKRSHFYSDQNGDFDGPDTSFSSSGKVTGIDQYKKGETNGISVAYYLNGNKKSEVNMENGKENGYYTSYYPNEKLESEGWIVDGDYQGEWHFYDELGRLTTKSYYEDGLLSGYKEEYDPGDKKVIEHKYHGGWLESVKQYKDGKVMVADSFPKMIGVYKQFYANGAKKSECNYVNGDFNGKYVTYFFDGSIETIAFYKHGFRDSTYTSYYYGGKKNTEGQYKFGDRKGVWHFYDEDGKLTNTAQYENDHLNGEKTVFFPDGNNDEILTYKDDELNGPVKKYEPGGTMAYQVNFEDDRAKSFAYLDKDNKMVPDVAINISNGSLKSFYPNGKPSRECFYSDGIKNGRDIVYYPNGQVRSVDTSSYDSAEGNSKEYYPNGKLKSEYNYKAGNAVGICREYNSEGKLIKEISYDNGINHGPAKYYNGDGKLIRTMTYENGVLLAVKDEK